MFLKFNHKYKSLNRQRPILEKEREREREKARERIKNKDY
jgi:hypothetical protein